jgi:hypothetical protein
VKSAMLINMGRLFLKWKSEMNTNYMKKGLVPKHMGKITEAQWKEFIQQKTDLKAHVMSNEFAEMSKKNIVIPVLCQNRELIVRMTQDQMFHTYGQKCSHITKCHNIEYNYYINNVFKD